MFSDQKQNSETKQNQRVELTNSDQVVQDISRSRVVGTVQKLGFWHIFAAFLKNETILFVDWFIRD